MVRTNRCKHLYNSPTNNQNIIKEKNKTTPAYSQNTGNMSPKSKCYLCWNSPESLFWYHSESWLLKDDMLTVDLTVRGSPFHKGTIKLKKHEALWDSVLQRDGNCPGSNIYEN